MLLITKVEYPEEMDTRFSQFSEPDEDILSGIPGMGENVVELKGADDILGLFNKIREEQEKFRKEQEAQEQKTPEGEKTRPVPEIPVDLTKMFEFSSMEQVERIAHVLDGYYDGQNDLYKNERQNHFFLMIHKSGHTPEEFNKVCNILSEYGTQQTYTPAAGAFMKEHYQVLLKNHALQTLAEL